MEASQMVVGRRIKVVPFTFFLLLLAGCGPSPLDSIMRHLNYQYGTYGTYPEILTQKLDSRKHLVAIDRDQLANQFGPYKIENNRYFLAGDFRTNVYDSRYHGTIHVDHIIAVANLVYWSKDPNGSFRWNRIFKIL